MSNILVHNEESTYIDADKFRSYFVVTAWKIKSQNYRRAGRRKAIGKIKKAENISSSNCKDFC